jgi:hypothetical protein
VSLLMDVMPTTCLENLEALGRRFGIRLADAGAERVRVQPAATAGGPCVEVAAADGRWMRLLSVRDPLAEAERWADETVLAGGPATVILAGSGLGYVLDAIERRDLPTRVVVVEPDPALARLLLERRDWRGWIESGRLALIVGPDYDGVPAVARAVEGVDEAPLYVHPVLARVWPEVMREAVAACGRLRFEAASNHEARRALAGRYLRHTLANAARVTREGDARSLVGLFRGTPAVIVAAGPSLDRNIHDLHVVRDRALIVACDTAVRPLLAHGLEPHLVVAIDPSVANACHLGALLEPRRTWLAAEASLHPSAFAHFEGRTFFFRIGDHAPWPWLREAGVDRLHVTVWGSVLTAAFDLVLRMGCDPVVFAGADLAYTGGRPYCRGTTFEAQWATWVASGATYEGAFALVMNRWPAVEAADVHGVAARTAAHMVAFRDWLASRAREASPAHIVNATGAGILHGPAIGQRRASDVLAACPPLDPETVQARLTGAYRPSPGPAAIFERIAELDRRGWPLPDAWSTPDPAASPAALRAALTGPEYAAWRLGRASASDSGRACCPSPGRAHVETP